MPKRSDHGHVALATLTILYMGCTTRHEPKSGMAWQEALAYMLSKDCTVAVALHRVRPQLWTEGVSVRKSHPTRTDTRSLLRCRRRG